MNGAAPYELFSAGVAVIGAVVWLLRLEGAVRNGAQRHDDYVAAHG